MNNKKLTRVIIVRTIQNKIMETIYKKQKRQQLLAMADLAIEHQTLTAVSIPCFMYKSVWYTSPVDLLLSKENKSNRRNLHYSLISKVEEIMKKKDFDNNRQKARIAAFVGCVLSKSKCIEDLQELFPSEIAIDIIDINIFTIGHSMNQKEKEEILKKHQKGLTALKQLYMLELLLQEN